MGILRHSKLNKDKVEEQTPANKKVKSSSSTFNSSESAFIISKLRQAQYTGAEFEQFYQIMAKLTKLSNEQ